MAYLSFNDSVLVLTFSCASQLDFSTAQRASKVAGTIEAPVVEDVCLRDCAGNTRTRQGIHDTSTNEDPKVRQLLIGQADVLVRITTV